MSDFDVVTGPAPRMPAKVAAELAAQQMPLAPAAPSPPSPPRPPKGKSVEISP